MSNIQFRLYYESLEDQKPLVLTQVHPTLPYKEIVNRFSLDWESYRRR